MIKFACPLVFLGLSFVGLPGCHSAGTHSGCDATCVSAGVNPAGYGYSQVPQNEIPGTPQQLPPAEPQPPQEPPQEPAPLPPSKDDFLPPAQKPSTDRPIPPPMTVIPHDSGFRPANASVFPPGE